ncbi:YbaB/EbfC family nucleoid-associated protein [Jiulongibacter sediminis]|jgi:DNA-binding YbaB/EbfC family protein|uniref:Nucleoid-associated protein AFM12_15290 n=1 Tax=Jiulongibacter sediminis TaxID=1605367 RepID=A0A0P7BS01_9BACT|nr:YbaB/EbfC family nucleoid-associated protein [Jiulongibacter sediminis]KPM47176.1 DNA-binding protein [Jiulongibacter sediminis]TBX22734.1 DNA-binding protein [Jiulongibacter sediminis]
MGLFDMAGMMGKMKELQSKMQETQEKLGDITAEGEAGGGMVKVTANGKKSLLKVEIEPELLNKEEIDILQDLIVAAANKALENAEAKAKEEMQSITEGMLPNIPGMDINSMFNK